MNNDDLLLVGQQEESVPDIIIFVQQNRIVSCFVLVVVVIVVVVVLVVLVFCCCCCCLLVKFGLVGGVVCTTRTISYSSPTAIIILYSPPADIIDTRCQKDSTVPLVETHSTHFTHSLQALT